MDLSALSNAVAGGWTLAKDIGKGGGGSADEPTVCMTLLPVALGIVFVVASDMRRRLGSRV
jgi:hypothetical protein